MFISRFARLVSLLALIVASVATVNAGNAGSIITKGNVHYLSNEVVFKWKDAASPKAASPEALAQAAVDKFSAYGAVESGPLFPGASFDAHSLHGIYSLRYDAELDPAAVVAKMKNDPAIEWIEPRFAYPTTETPNDEYYSNQPYLAQIEAPAAWDVVKGDRTIIIAITDTGLDWDHPDLAGAVWMNRDETAGNGVDDDNNGYIDDIRGWDFGGNDGTPDNNPMEDAPDHGTHVAGLAGAVTNNQIGIASAAYNVQLMAIKTSRDNYRDVTTGSPYVLFGYEAIVYAADNGAHIINCSWGSGGYSIAGAEAVAYALEKGCVIVGAAGNENTADPHYPSSYSGVLSVASVSTGDKKSSFSNYGADVDVAAPGSFIYSTWQNNTYLNISGTSMASPIVASVAALVKTRFPDYTNLQIIEQIRATADDISFENPMFENLLGRGRVNAYRAVTETGVVSVRPENVVFSDAASGNDDDIFSPGETISITGDFYNYLAPTQNLQVTLEDLSTDEYVTLGTTSFQAGGISTLGSASNSANPFTFTIKDDVPENVRLRFLLRLTDGSYEDVAIIETTGNPSYATQKGNNISLTITSQGTIGFNDYSSNQQGDGFIWNDGQNMLFEGSLILTNGESNVIDHARGTDQSGQNLDFRPVTPFTIEAPGARADIQGSTVFDDSGDLDPLDVEVELNSYSFTDDEYEDFIILEYVITNNSRQAINGLYAGLFCDWDLTGGDGDIIGYNEGNNFGFVRNTDRNFNTMVANALISDEHFNFYALMNDGSGDGFGIYDGFSDAEKYAGLTSGLTYQNAGPGDVSMVTSSGPHNILINGKLAIAFALTAAEDIDVLGQNVLTARQKYQDILTGVDDGDAPAAPLSFALEQNYPNPFNPATSINYTIAEASEVTLFVYDLLGRKVAELVNGYQQPGAYRAEFTGASLASGVYFYELRAGAKRDLKKMLLMK